GNGVRRRVRGGRTGTGRRRGIAILLSTRLAGVEQDESAFKIAAPAVRDIVLVADRESQPRSAAAQLLVARKNHAVGGESASGERAGARHMNGGSAGPV